MAGILKQIQAADEKKKREIILILNERIRL